MTGSLLRGATGGRAFIAVLASVALAGFGGTAVAAPLIQYQLYDGTPTTGTLIGSGSDAGSGTLSFSATTSSYFVAGNANGASHLPDPFDFQTAVSSALQQSMSAGTLTVLLTQTGLTNFNAGTVGNTFTANTLNGGDFQSVSMANYLNSDNAAFGMETLLADFTYTGAVSASSPNLSKFVTTGSPFSETVAYAFKFGSGTPGGVDASSHITAAAMSIPEPSSLALVGGSLFGLALLRRRKGPSRAV